MAVSDFLRVVGHEADKTSGAQRVVLPRLCGQRSIMRRGAPWLDGQSARAVSWFGGGSQGRFSRPHSTPARMPTHLPTPSGHCRHGIGGSHNETLVWPACNVCCKCGPCAGTAWCGSRCSSPSCSTATVSRLCNRVSGKQARSSSWNLGTSRSWCHPPIHFRYHPTSWCLALRCVTVVDRPQLSHQYLDLHVPGRAGAVVGGLNWVWR